MTYALWTVPGLLALIFLTTAPSYQAAGSAGAQSTATTPAASEPPVETGYAPVNGLRMYYEIHGSGGTPLVILHGAFVLGPSTCSGRWCQHWPRPGR
jgi:hypothetical protein